MLLLAAGTAAGLVAGCTSAGPDRVGTGVTPTATATTTQPSASTSTTTGATPLPSGVPGTPEALTTGLPLPWSLVPLPPAEDGAGRGWLLSLRDQATVLHLAVDGTASPVATSAADGRVPGTTPLGEGGLLGLALREDAGSTWVYTYQTVGGQGSPSNQVVRMLLTGSPPSSLALGTPEPILTGIPRANTTQRRSARLRPRRLPVRGHR